MLNDIAESSLSSCAETSTIGCEALELCDERKTLRRPNDSDGWKRRTLGLQLGMGCDDPKMIGMCRAKGIPTADEALYFRALERTQGSWHSTRTEANRNIYLKLFDDA